MTSDSRTDPRLDERSNVFLGATLHGATESFPVRIRNISAMGAMVDGQRLPPQGSVVNLRRGSLAANAEVAWQSGDFRGLRFDGAVSVDDWVKRLGHAGQARVDKVILALRDGAPLPVAADEEPPLSIEDLSDQLLGICERIASAPGVTVEIGEDVVRIEAIALTMKKLTVEH